MANRFSANMYFNKVLHESENFYAVPSLGSIIPGWVLIIPKTYFLNFANVPRHHFYELESFVEEIRAVLAFEFGSQSVLFEHGPHQSASRVGCGVDYAHLHMVPFQGDLNLITGANELGYTFNWIQLGRLESIKKFDNGTEGYLFLETKDGKRYGCSSAQIPSQLFRRVISAFAGVPEKFEWREHPFHENIQKTINTFSSVVLS